MVKNLIFILTICIFFSCTKETKVREKYPDGSPKVVVYINKMNKKEYVQKEFYPDEKLKSEGKYLNGKMEGKWTYYYSDGKIWSMGNFKNGIENGLKTVYYPNGYKRFEGEYVMGVRKGEWKYWDENGNLLLKKEEN